MERQNGGWRASELGLLAGGQYFKHNSLFNNNNNEYLATVILGGQVSLTKRNQDRFVLRKEGIDIK